MSIRIPDLPDVPPEIIKKINERKLCFFLGAGVSKLIGCNSWKEVSTQLVEKCSEMKCIDYKRKESILRINEPKKIITICYNIMCKSGKEALFFEEIKHSLKPDAAKLSNYDIYEELSLLPAIYITTNIDTHFDSAFKEGIVYDVRDFNPSNIFLGKLYKIHGTIDAERSIVFTVPKYLERYRNQNIIRFLDTVFREYSIVFLGYGLEEYEILDFLVTKFGGEYENSPTELKHWIVLPYYQGEDYLWDYDKEYFKPLGINVIPFEKDIDGYSQLYKVIKKWRKEITESSIIPHEMVREMEETVDNL
jgi:hypothetical protein